MEKRKISKPVKLAAIAAIAVMAAGASVYAVNASGSISEEEAKQIALAEVSGADSSHITKFRKDMDDGRTEYDVEIIYGGYEYDFEISAKDGTIFDRSKEKIKGADAAADPSAGTNSQQDSQQAPPSAVVTPSASAGTPSGAASSGIGLEKARSIALGQVSGASGGNITKAYQDYDDGRLEYDIEIRYNGYEYDFEIDGATGSIVSKDVDRIDFDDDDRDDRYDDDFDDDRYDD